MADGSYSQHGEDRGLVALLSRIGVRGTYVDVGCNHPVRLSNTYLLYTLGWRGICIDPLPRYEPLYRKWRPGDSFVSAAVSDAQGQLTLYEFEADVLSTLDPALAILYEKSGHKVLRHLSVPVRPLGEILEESGLVPPVALLCVDTEGFEARVLRSLDLDRWEPAVVCIEAVTAAGTSDDEAADVLLRAGYSLVSGTGLNHIYVSTKYMGEVG